jgi:fucose 4-O-acetylase-like acetyltransferase
MARQRTTVTRTGGPGPVPAEPERAAGEPARPSEHNRYVDFLRVLSITLVVIGHWLVTSPVYRQHGFEAPDVLAIIHWGGWVTLAFQVMPVFFLVGGYAAAVSWQRQLAAGHADARAWLTSRAVRLLIPTAAYAAIALVGAAIAIALGAPEPTLALAGWAIALQLWFLPVFIALTALTPLLHAAHRRWGLLVPATSILLGIGVDFVVVYDHVTLLGWLNYLLVWGAVYQAGFSWQDGTLTHATAAGRRILAGMAVCGTLLFLGLVLFGPFPASLIGVAGEAVNNTAPPSAALAAYATAQTALLIAIAPYVSRWLRRPRPWRVVERANKVVMTVYLWHMVPVIITGLALYVTGIMPQPGVGGTEWWELRAPWLAANILVLCGLMLLLQPLVRALERSRRRPQGGASASAPTPVTATATAAAATGSADGRLGEALATTLLWLGIVFAGYALYRFAVFGFAPSGEFPTIAVACYAAGLALVLASRLVPTRTARVS